MKLLIVALALALIGYLQYYTNAPEGAIYFIGIIPALIAVSFFVPQSTLQRTKDIIAANAVDVNSEEFEIEFREKYHLGPKDTRTDEEYLADLRKQYSV